MRILIVLFFIFTITGCSGSFKMLPRALGNGPSSSEICTKQGININNEQHDACVKFYEVQNYKNRRNIFIAGAIALLGGIMFQDNCDCFFGPDRGIKFRP